MPADFRPAPERRLATGFPTYYNARVPFRKRAPGGPRFLSFSSHERSTATQYYLGLDNGGTNTKAALFDKGGKLIGVASRSTKASNPAPGVVERDMDDMWRDNCAVIRELLEKTGVKASDIAGLACCGHGKGVYLWGKDGKPVRPGILSSDNRAWQYPRKWKENGTEKKVFERSAQHIMACQPVALLAWLKDNEPESYAKIRWIFGCKDYVRFRLTGQAFAETTDCSGCNLMNLHTQKHDQALLDLFGIGDLFACLPPLKLAADLCGEVSEEAARLTGLRAGTPVAGGMFDIDACAIAAGITDEDRICMIAGTWSINEYIRREPVVDGSVLLNSLFCMPGYYLIEESSPTSAANNEWFVQTLLPEARDAAAKEGKSIFDITNQWVASIPADEFCPVFLPFTLASNVHPLAKASFVGISSYHTRAHLTRSVYEGIAFSHRHHLDKLMATRQTPPDCIRLAGGVTKSPEWVQMFADVMELPVEVVDVSETGTLGCAIAAAVATRAYPDYAAAVKAMVRIEKRVMPNTANSAAYRAKYRAYRRVIDLLDPLWDEIQPLMQK